MRRLSSTINTTPAPREEHGRTKRWVILFMHRLSSKCGNLCKGDQTKTSQALSHIDLKHLLIGVEENDECICLLT